MQPPPTNSKAFDLAGSTYRKKRSPRPHAEPVRLAPSLGDAERDELVGQGPGHARPEITSHPQVRLKAVARAALEAKRVRFVDCHDVVDLGSKRQILVSIFAVAAHLDGREGRIVDPDAHLLNWRDQHVPLAVLPKNGRKKPHERGPGDW